VAAVVAAVVFSATVDVAYVAVYVYAGVVAWTRGFARFTAAAAITGECGRVSSPSVV
jgi:hypothetical protein